MKFKLNLLKEDEESDFLQSHFLGCPDVPSIWNDNAEFYNDEIFLGQINLEEINIDNLPNKGILYFFLAIGSRPYRPIVRYTNNLDDMERIDFNSEIECDINLNKEYLLEESTDGIISLFESFPKFKYYHPNNNDICLLDVSDLDIFNNLEDKLCFIINKKDLDNLDFSKVKLSLLLDN